MADADSLRAALAGIAAEDAPAVVAEARAAARIRARELIEDALVDEIVRAAQAGPGAQRTGGDVLWAYCVVSAADAGALGQVDGVEPGSSVECVVEGDLAALVSRVPLPEYGDERLREHLNDIEWVDRTARAHEGVLEQALSDCTIVPLRLCTLFRSDDSVREFLRDDRTGLCSSLAALTGRAEWGLKLFVDSGRLNTSLSDDPGDRAGGTAYLDRKQREREAREAADNLIAHYASEAHERVGTIADAARTNPAQRPEAHGRQAEMVLNGVYLVKREHEDELRRTVAELRAGWPEYGIELELTGPWPAYNFVSGTEPVPR